MAAEIITLQYTSGSSVAYSLVLSSFLDEEIPRKIVGEAAIERTILGKPAFTLEQISRPKQEAHPILKEPAIQPIVNTIATSTITTL